MAVKKDNEVIYWGVVSEVQNTSGKEDYTVILKYITKVYPYEVGKRFEEAMTNVSKKGLSFESITRARRKLQNKYPELKNNKIADFRDKKQKDYIAYSRKK